jgi:Holliday junction resolvasome RuvABC endonuclease subunit
MKVLAFDQTLTNCAWVLALVDSTGLYPTNQVSMKIEKPGPPRGMTNMLVPLLQAEAVRQRALEVLSVWRPDLVLVERPPVRRPGMERESSLLSCGAIVSAAMSVNVPVRDVSAQDAKRRLTGFANATKPLVRQEFLKRWPGYDKIMTNEHLRDAWLVVWEWHCARAEKAA